MLNRELLDKAIAAKEKCSSYCTITIENGWKISVSAYPDGHNIHETVAYLTPIVGKLAKKQSDYGTNFEFVHESDELSVRVVTHQKCQVVGYKIERRPVKKLIETGEEEVVKTPVTDCDLRAGKVTAGQFEPIGIETVAEG